MKAITTLTSIGLAISLSLLGSGCEKDNTTQPNTDVVPKAPSNLRVERPQRTSLSANLLWQDSSNIETGFELERKLVEGQFATLTLIPAQEGFGTVTYIDTNIPSTGIFTYRVRSVNRNAKSSYSNELTVIIDGLYPSREGRLYADTHFSEEVYRQYEYQLAQNPVYGDSGAYNGTRIEWDEEACDVKIHYLPERGFSHDLPFGHDSTSNDSATQQYYVMIGKYIHQYGFGWDDVYVMFNGQVVSYNGDDPATAEYDDRFDAAQRSIYYMKTYIEP